MVLFLMLWKGSLLKVDHEKISSDLMHRLNQEFNNQLSLAISIFNGLYHKKFLKQLVSSQLDMDRMDYLTRDSYYSGVAEGVIGYKRIISMLNVVDDELVIEEKGVFSIEKFLVARHIMYWQVYLHKNSIAAEQMLKTFVLRVKELSSEKPSVVPDCRLKKFFADKTDEVINESNYLDHFVLLDDIDIYSYLKIMKLSKDPVLSMLATRILNRDLFKIILKKSPFDSDFIDSARQKVKSRYNLKNELIDQLLIQGKESSKAYDSFHEEIKILSQDGTVNPISEYLDVLFNVERITKYYMCYPE